MAVAGVFNRSESCMSLCLVCNMFVVGFTAYNNFHWAGFDTISNVYDFIVPTVIAILAVVAEGQSWRRQVSTTMDESFYPVHLCITNTNSMLSYINALDLIYARQYGQPTLRVITSVGDGDGLYNPCGV
ncbi:hypothetical protein Aduo_008693 [Ancylostoma duodenale]